MPVREKIFIPNEIYFITFTILGWKNIFTEDKYCELVYKWFDYMKEKYGDKIYAANYLVGKGFYDVEIMEL